MNKIKKFYQDHKEAVIVGVAVATVTTAVVAIKVTNNRKIVSAVFDPYNSEIDDAAFLHVLHGSGKTTLIKFETK